MSLFSGVVTVNCPGAAVWTKVSPARSTKGGIVIRNSTGGAAALSVNLAEPNSIAPLGTFAIVNLGSAAGSVLGSGSIPMFTAACDIWVGNPNAGAIDVQVIEQNTHD